MYIDSIDTVCLDDSVNLLYESAEIDSDIPLTFYINTSILNQVLRNKVIQIVNLSGIKLSNI